MIPCKMLSFDYNFQTYDFSDDDDDDDDDDDMMMMMIMLIFITSNKTSWLHPLFSNSFENTAVT